MPDTLIVGKYALVEVGEVAQVEHDPLNALHALPGTGQHPSQVLQQIRQVDLVSQFADPLLQIRLLFGCQLGGFLVELKQLGKGLGVALEDREVVGDEGQGVIDLVGHFRN